MELFPAVTTIAQTIQLSLAPVFLLGGIFAFLGVLTERLTRVVDRVRMLERFHAEATEAERARHVWELGLLDRRMTVIHRAVFLCILSAIAICSVVALLFVAELAKWAIGTVLALIFILAMVMIVTGMAQFVVEVRLSLQVTRVRGELLEKKLT